MRFAVDTGGTFTDLVIEDDEGTLSLYKSATIPSDPVQGILDVFAVAAAQRGETVPELLGRGQLLIHGTTRGLNAVLTGTTAKTAFLTTEGHPDILLFREGGRKRIFDLSIPYPEPYVPRSLTYEISERVGPEGEILIPLNESATRYVLQRLAEEHVEAVAVCLLWSITNPAHELRVGELIAEQLPGVPFTLSHQLNPCLREYRRASSTCIDASLKPVMSDYIRSVDERLSKAGFGGRVLIVTSAGSALDAEEVAGSPVHSLNSGPSMAPVAGRFFAAADAAAETAIVADTGGTSYDVSVVRRGRIPWTRESWIGEPFFGHMTGFPSVDVRSVGAGGGSIARVDSGGLLHVGPESAGAVPGPVCYAAGGTRPTVTDACVVLGYVDPHYFLGGRRALDAISATESIADQIGRPLGLGVSEAAAAILQVATEKMVSAIEEITIHQGIDPRQAILVGGGGAAGFNAVTIGRQLGCTQVLIPPTGPVLSAAGALMSDLARSFERAISTTDRDFDFVRVNEVLEELEERACTFIAAAGAEYPRHSIEFSVEARYPHQVWELECPLHTGRIVEKSDLDQLVADFHELHREVFSISDNDSPIEFASWHVRALCHMPNPGRNDAEFSESSPRQRDVYIAGEGMQNVPVWRLDAVPFDERLGGPAIVEATTSTIVVAPGAEFARHRSGTLVIWPGLARDEAHSGLELDDHTVRASTATERAPGTGGPWTV